MNSNNINGIKKLISKMSENFDYNYKLIINYFEYLEYKDEDNQSILHILVDNKYNEHKCFLAIKTLLKAGLSPNTEDDFKYNFIQTALYTGYSEEFIINIIKESLKYGLNVNHVDSDLDTIMHTAIYSDDYLGEVINIYKLLCSNGFDSTLRDHDGRTLLMAMLYQKQYSEKQIEAFNKVFITNRKMIEALNKVFPVSIEEIKENEEITSSDKEIKEEEPTYIEEITLSEKDMKKLEKYGKILNLKDYVTNPTIGRENELKNIMITLAQDKKNPIIVGESGVGKTSVIEELAYRIKKGQVPKFLRNKVIFEMNPSDVVSGCTYVGQFEESLTNLLNICKENNIIIFIDEIHTIYGIGSSSSKDYDMSSILKHYIDKDNIKVVGATTSEEYNKYFGNDALKRRFEKVVIKEPDENTMYEIIDKVFNDYYLKTGITFENKEVINEIINIIIYATKKEHRTYNDVINNPDLAVSIIDRAFAFAKYYDHDYITIDDFVESFKSSDRIYESVLIKTIDKLNNIKPSNNKSHSKILKIDFNRGK